MVLCSGRFHSTGGACTAPLCLRKKPSTEPRAVKKAKNSPSCTENGTSLQLMKRRPGSLLVRPVSVLGEVLAGSVLLAALAVAGGAVAVEDVEQEDRQARPDAHRPTLPAQRLVGGEQDHETGQHEQGGDDVADRVEAHDCHATRRCGISKSARRAKASGPRVRSCVPTPRRSRSTASGRSA